MSASLRRIAPALWLLFTCPAAGAIEVGDLVVATASPAQVLELPLATGVPAVIASGGFLVQPAGVAADPYTGMVYVADRAAGPGGLGAVIRIDPEGYEPGDPDANQTVISSGNLLAEIEDIAVVRDAVLVASGSGLGGVIQVLTRTGAQSRVFDFAAANGVEADLFGRIYATRSTGPNEIVRWNPAGPALEPVSAGNLFQTLVGMAFEQDGKIATANFGASSAPDGKVVRVDPAVYDSGNPGANQSLLASGGELVDPTDVAVANDRHIYVSDRGAAAGAGAVYRVDRTSGAQTLVASGVGQAVGLDVFRRGPRSGDVAVADSGASRRVLLVDPRSGAQRLVASFDAQFPVDVEWEPSGLLLVLMAAGGSGLPPRVLRMDPASGQSSPVTIGGPTSTNDFSVVERMVRDEQELFVADSATFVAPTFETGAIFEVNLDNGTRTLFTGGGTRFRALSIGLVPGDGDFVVGTTDSGFDNFDLVRVDRVNRSRQVITSNGDVKQPRGLLIDPAGATSYVAAATGGSQGFGAVVAVDLGTGAQDVLVEYPGVTEPQDLARDARGRLLVSHQMTLPGFVRQGQILRFDPVGGGGAPQLVSFGGLLDDPDGLAVFVPEPAAVPAAGAALLALAALSLHGVRRRRRPPRTRGARAARRPTRRAPRPSSLRARAAAARA